MHALIIEDEWLIALELQTLVLPLGFGSCDIAADEAEAVTMAMRRRPDLITADLCLAQGCGLVAVRTIRHLLGAIPVVYVTGNTKLLTGEVDPIVDKPFTAASLRRACEMALGRSAKGAAPPHARTDTGMPLLPCAVGRHRGAGAMDRAPPCAADRAGTTEREGIAMGAPPATRSPPYPPDRCRSAILSVEQLDSLALAALAQSPR
jgi:DNA-binding response OmpR family regulator